MRSSSSLQHQQHAYHLDVSSHPHNNPNHSDLPHELLQNNINNHSLSHPHPPPHSRPHHPLVHPPRARHHHPPHQYYHDHDHLLNIIEKMKDPKTGVSIKDRSVHFHVYHNCFVGQEFIAWCIVNGIAPSRPLAELLGQDMLDRGFVFHVCNDLPFKDGYFLYSFYAAHLSNSKIDHLVTNMKNPANGLAIQDRTQFLRTYRHCFIGSECVKWLLTHAADLVATKEQAVQIGQALMNKGIIHHSANQHPFIDGDYFYYFQKAAFSGYMGKLSKSGLTWKMRWFALRDVNENRLWYFSSLRDPVPKNFIPLGDSFLRVYHDNEVGHLELTIPSRIYKLRAASEYMLGQWVEHLTVHTQNIHADNYLIEKAEVDMIESEYAVATEDVANADRYRDTCSPTIDIDTHNNTHSTTISSTASVDVNMESLLTRKLNIHTSHQSSSSNNSSSGSNNNNSSNNYGSYANNNNSSAQAIMTPNDAWVDRSGVKKDIFIKNSV